MKKILVLLAALLAPAAAHAQSSKATLISDINTQFADNASGQITAAKLRTVTTDMVNSWVDYITCASAGVVQWTAGVPSCVTSISLTGLTMGSTATISQAFAGQTLLVGQNNQYVAASATQAEAVGLDVIVSATGATPDALVAYKAARSGSATCNSGSGYCWGLNYVVTVGAGGSKRGAIGLETNNNNEWGNYTGSPASPYFAGALITGTNTAGYGSCAVCVEFGGTGALWQAGVHFGPAGTTHFNTAAIWDETNSPTIVKATGTHTVGIDFSAAVLTTAFYSAGYLVDGAGNLAANSANIAATTQSTSSVTGSLLTAGGLGVAKDIFGGGSVNATTFAAAGTYVSTPKIRATSAAPTPTACGGGSPAAVGNDMAGEVTLGTTASGCVVTFANAYTSAPFCVVTWQTNLASMQYTISNVAITLVQTSTSSNKVNYHCIARSGG